MKLHRVVIYVADPQRCAAFYRDHLGIQPKGEWTADWAELDGEGCNLGFHQAHGTNGPVKTPTDSPQNPHKISFLVPDVHALREKLITRGVKMGELRDFDGWQMCNGTDVEGHTFQLTNR